jgi:ABC-2 type transport system permease protein
MPAPLVHAEGLSRRFAASGQPAIDNLSFRIAPGGITGLVGPDGAGKTTLLRLLTGLLLPDSGSLRVLGLDPRRAAAQLHRLAGYMPQQFGLYQDLTVRENLDLHADLRAVHGPARAAAFNRLLAFSGLAPFAARRASALSGGMQQKLGLACALLGQPRLLLLDEPSVGVDPVSRRELWHMVQELANAGIGVIWSTAYLDEAEKCQTVLLLDAGRLLFAGPPGELTSRLAGRAFRVHGARDRRALVARARAQPGIVDGSIQGHAARLVTAAGAPPPEPAALGEPGLRVEAVPPRFEDAFVDILGGSPGAHSALAAGMPALPVASPEAAVIEADRLGRVFGAFHAARDISFSVRQGEIFGLLGPNGAGKSTTFKMLCGLLQPSTGRARVAGLDLLHAAGAARARIGYMAQKFSLYGNLSAAQNLAFFAGAYGLRGRARRAAIDRMIGTFGLGPHLDADAATLPLGFKQRLALACAVMHDPAVLFLDEPTAGVDPLTRREFWTHINGMVGKGRTVLVTTHFMDEAEYCDRIGLIDHGRLRAIGSPDELKQRVRTPARPEPTLEDAFIALVRETAPDAPVAGALPRAATAETTTATDAPNDRQPVAAGGSRPGDGPGPGALPRAATADIAGALPRAAAEEAPRCHPATAALLRLRGMVRKEMLQVVRDPSSILIAFVLPLILLFLFGFGLSLDADRLQVGIVLEDSGPEARSLAAAVLASPWFAARVDYHRDAFTQALVNGAIKGMLVVPGDFARRLHTPGAGAPLQVITDGSEPNTAQFVHNHVAGVWRQWLAQRAAVAGSEAAPPVVLEPRVWYNESMRSRNFLVPGVIALIMMLIGALLTALVIAREWERGTMEALMATPVGIREILAGKLIPYYLLGISAMALCTALAVWLFDVPLRGSFAALFLVSSVFLLCALGLGLLISTLARNQFVAAQAALLTAYLPTVLLSGFIFEIPSMPAPIRLLTSLVPARYFVNCLQTLFLSGTVWPLLLPNIGAMLLIAAVFFTVIARRTVKRLA